MLSQSDLDAIRSRAEATTYGEWDYRKREGCKRDTYTVTADHTNTWIAQEVREPDATFIAHARTDVPALLDTVAETRAELVKHFDDIDIDYEGEPNDLDYMVQLAGEKLRSSRSHCESETERANVAEHKSSQLRSRFALELAARTTPDMVEMERMKGRITELESDGEERLSAALTTIANGVGVHRCGDPRETASHVLDKFKELKEVNGGLRKWEDVSRLELETRVECAESDLAQLKANQQAHILYAHNSISSTAGPAKHPLQTIEMVDGCARFTSNPIVRHLLDSHPDCDMNKLAIMQFDDDDAWHFAQLIGYSVSGGGGLSYANEAQADYAQRRVELMMHWPGPNKPEVPTP